MIQVPVRVRRHTASAAMVAAFVALYGPVAHAGVVGLPQWGATPGAAHPTAADAARCLEVEEATARGRGGARFQMAWSRDASCQGSTASAGAPAAVAPGSSQGGPAPVQPTAPLSAPPAAAVPPAPATPTAAPTATAPAATPAQAQGFIPASAGAPDAPPTPATPPAPAPRVAEDATDTLPGPPMPPGPDPTPQRSAPEVPAPEAITISPEQQSGPGPGHGITGAVNELTGISPPPIDEVRAPPPGTIPEPSSLWLLVLGAAAAWRSRRR